MKTVEEAMDESFETFDKKTFISDAVKKLAKKKERTILVASDTEVLGIVTTSDIIYKVIAKDKDPKTTTLEKIMSSPVHAIGPGNTLQEAAKMMNKKRIKKLPVINEKGEILGIITISDILAADPDYVNLLVNLQLPVQKTEIGS
ncbi:MAG: CBS domain-containing protein [archaeon]